jgi:hypothetical protein
MLEFLSGAAGAGGVAGGAGPRGARANGARAAAVGAVAGAARGAGRRDRTAGRAGGAFVRHRHLGLAASVQFPARRGRAHAREGGEVWPAEVERWPIDRLIPYAKNSRTHSEAQIAQLAGGESAFRNARWKRSSMGGSSFI